MQEFALARRAMVESQLRPQAVTDVAVLAAMGSVAREDYVPEGARAAAYFDRSVPLADGRTLMPPAAIGRLLSEAAPRAGQKALVVASTGYPAALLRAIGLDVTEVAADAAPAKGAYDLILIDGAVEEVPASLAKALADDGRIATALVDRGVSRLAIGRPVGGTLAFRTLVDADVGRLSTFDRPRAFTF